MPAKAKRGFQIETDWLRAYSETHLPTEALFEYYPADLRRAGVTLVQLRNVFRSGTVVYSDKIEDRGAVWVTEGDDGDGNEHRLTLRIIEYESVKLLRIEASNPDKDNPHDAA